MGKPTGFLEIERKDLHDQDPAKRISHWNEFHDEMSEPEIRDQAARCMDCGVPFCHTGTELNNGASGCPVYNLIPDWNDMIYRNQWQEAVKLLLKTNNFPEFTGRVCPAPCEGACVLGINEPAVTIKNHEYAIIEKAFAEGWITAHPPQNRTDKTVAIIGSGPAGLAAADELNKEGHTVTVFERDDRPGGLLMYGIPNMKLDKQLVVNRRIDLMQAEGIIFKTNTAIGKDISLSEVHQKFDAVILATGATIPRDLPVSGRDLKGVHFAMEFLKQNTQSLLDSELKDQKFINAAGKKVVVIGGGDTGTDCVATALRHGCKSVVQLEIMAQPPAIRAEDNPWPEFPLVYKLDYGQEEAKAVQGSDPRRYQMLTKGIAGDKSVTGLEVAQIEWVTEDGKRFPRELEGTETKIEADLVLLAMGFVGAEREGFEESVQFSNQATVEAEFNKYQTTMEGVFAAGDCRRGQSLVVWAINEGRGAAKQCHHYLSEQLKWD